MQFDHHHLVRFAEVDAAGIVFFARAFEIAHAAFEGLLSEVGLPLAEILVTQPWIMPLVHAEADYKAPMRLGDKLVVGVRVERIGRTSVSLRFEITGDQPHVVVRHVHVCMDRGSGRPIAIPAALRAAFAAYLIPS